MISLISNTFRIVINECIAELKRETSVCKLCAQWSPWFWHGHPFLQFYRLTKIVSTLQTSFWLLSDKVQRHRLIAEGLVLHIDLYVIVVEQQKLFSNMLRSFWRTLKTERALHLQPYQLVMKMLTPWFITHTSWGLLWYSTISLIFFGLLLPFLYGGKYQFLLFWLKKSLDGLGTDILTRAWSCPKIQTCDLLEHRHVPYQLHQHSLANTIFFLLFSPLFTNNENKNVQFQ